MRYIARMLVVFLLLAVGSTAYAATKPNTKRKPAPGTATQDAPVPSFTKPVNGMCIPNTPSALYALKGVCVNVEELPPAVTTAGVTKEEVNTVSELHIRQAGISVVSEDFFLKSSRGYGVVYVSMNALDLKEGTAYTVSVSAELDAVLCSTSSAKCLNAVVWDKEIIAYAPASEASARIKESLAGLVDMFANDFLKANPKK